MEQDRNEEVMNGVNEAVRRLIDEIQISDTYREYDAQRQKVNQFPELKEKIDEFRSRNFELQRSEDNALDKIEEFEKQYADFREDPLVADFLAAELAFCRMIQEINTKIADAIHFE
ncbi:MAG: YlbF family regulator [Lachnospiraceae bacterium]|nr:YlbF family regulator [Lachnospiraceae bacterium]